MCDIIVIVYLRITCKNKNQNIFLLMFSLFDTSTKLMLFLKGKKKMYSFCKPNKHQKQWIIFLSPFLNSLHAAAECTMLDRFEFCYLDLNTTNISGLQICK